MAKLVDITTRTNKPNFGVADVSTIDEMVSDNIGRNPPKQLNILSFNLTPVVDSFPYQPTPSELQSDFQTDLEWDPGQFGNEWIFDTVPVGKQPVGEDAWQVGLSEISPYSVTTLYSPIFKMPSSGDLQLEFELELFDASHAIKLQIREGDGDWSDFVTDAPYTGTHDLLKKFGGGDDGWVGPLMVSGLASLAAYIPDSEIQFRFAFVADFDSLDSLGPTFSSFSILEAGPPPPEF